MTYEDAIFDWIDDTDEDQYTDDFYAGFNDATEIIDWIDEHEDFRIKIADMAGDELPNILDRFNELIENAKEADEPTIFIGTEVPQKEIDEQEEIDLTPDEDIFFEKPSIQKQVLLLQDELEITRKELEELEEEEQEEKEEEFEEEIEEELIENIIEEEKPSITESIKSIGSSIRKFLGF